MQYHPKSISIDGPDGVGKDIFAKFVAKELNRQTGEQVQVIVPNCFKNSEEAVKLGKIFNKLTPKLQNSYPGDICYRLAYKANYKKNILPTLQGGQWVIQPSSDIRSVAYTLSERSLLVAKFTKFLITSGFLTRNVLPMHRIFLNAKPKELIHRIKGRNLQSASDPGCLRDCIRRINSYKKAREWAKNYWTHPDDSGRRMRWVELDINTVPDEQLKPYLSRLSKVICKWILKQEN